MIALLTAFFTALAEALKIWAVGERYRLSKEIEADIRADEIEEARLRRLGGSDNHRAADLVRERALRRAGIVADLPAAGAGTAGGAAGANPGGDLRAANK